MRNVTRTALRQTFLVVTFAVVESSLLWFLNHSIATGILAGSGVSLLCFWLLAHDIAAFSERRVRVGYILRYLIYALVLASAGLVSSVFFTGCVIGVFNGKLTIVLFGRWLGETQSDPQ